VNRSGRLATFCGLGSVAALVVGAMDAAANFGSTAASGNTEVSLGNNRWHSWSFWTSDSNWRTALNDAATYSYGNVTDLVVSRAGDNQSSDVRLITADFGPIGELARTSCPSDGTRGGSDPTEWCWNQWIKINQNSALLPTDATGRKSLMCHEFGHTVGLRHPAGSDPHDTCMVAANWPYTGLSHSNPYNSEWDQINANY